MERYGNLEDTLNRLDLECSNLRENCRYSLNLLQHSHDQLRDALQGYVDEPFDIVVLGSLARQEASLAADMDYLVVAHGLPQQALSTREFLRQMDQVRERAGMGEPGSTGIFARVISAAELTERIGLEDDTNRTQTHRLLLLQESRSIWQPDKHQKLIAAILNRYLADYEKPKAGVPRFLMNDVNRYWTTLGVDYQAKRWRDLQSSWGLRFLKFRISRKLTYAGTIASLLLTETATEDYLLEQFSLPPLSRLGRLHEHLSAPGKELLRDSFNIADQFAQFLGQKENREKAKKAETARDLEDRLPEMVQASTRLHENLTKIFFRDNERISERAIRYLNF